MKKLVVLLSLALTLALAAPAFAAVTPEWSLEGEANFGMMFGQNPNTGDYQITGNVNKLLAKLTLSAIVAVPPADEEDEEGEEGDAAEAEAADPEDANPKAKFSFEVVVENKEENKLQEGTVSKPKNPNFGDGAFSLPLELGISNVVFTFNGAYWKNGPELTTQIGNLDAYWSDYIAGENKAADDADVPHARSAKGDGVTITGLTVGPFDSSVALLFVERNRRLLVTSWDGQLDGVGVDFTTATHREDGDLVHDLHLGVGIEPADGLSVAANYATDGRTGGYVYDLNATLSTIPNIELTAGVRGIDPDAAWSPVFAKRNEDDDDCKDRIGDLCAHDSMNGINVGVSTTQAGIDLGLTYRTSDHPVDNTKDEIVTKFTAGTVLSEFDLSGAVTLTDKVDDSKDKTKFEVSVGRSFNNINAKYSFSTEKEKGAADPTVVHTISADTTIDTPLADGVKLSGQVKIDSSKLDGNAQVHTSAEWTAPNGLKLGLHYANYNRKDHGPIPNEGEPSSNFPVKADGFYATAEYGIKF